MSIFNSLEFDGINSLDNDVYITGESVYDAPERDVEVVEIAGRNGNFLLDKGRWKNIEVTYHCGTFGQDQTEFGTKMRAFRNKLASKIGYMRLTDTYHPDEFRMGAFKSALEVDPVSYKRAGEFDVKFDCKPQRWLTDGEIPVTIGEWGETETATGETVTIENPNGNLSLKSLNVAIEPVQNLNGYDHPWSGGSGKNKLQNQATSQTINGITWAVNSDGTVTANGTATAASNLTIWGGTSITFDTAWVMTESMILTCEVAGWTTPLYVSCYSSDGRSSSKSGNSANLSAGERIRYVQLQVPNGRTVNNVVFKPMLRASDSATGFEPYENICPISGHDSVDVIVSPTTTASDGDTYTTALGRTVYGGTLDVVSGELTVDRAMVDLGSLSWQKVTSSNVDFFIATVADRATGVGNILSDMYYTDTSTASIHDGEIKGSSLDNSISICDSRYTTASDFKTAMNGHQLVYELATPQTYQLTAQQIELLTGTNNIWSDGDITVEYGKDPNILYNPTPYDASPLLMVEGYGNIGFNGHEISIEHIPMGEAFLHYAGNGIVFEQYGGTVSIEFNQALVNNGDEIYFYRYSSSYFHSVDFRLKSIHVTDVESRTYTNSNPDVTSPSDLSFSFDNISFIAGTPQTVTNTCTITAVLRNGGGTETASWTGTISYDGNNKITFTITQSSSSHIEFGDTGYINWTDLYADSTVQALGHPTYIDCDLGDAYMIKDGLYISLNSYIDLGSDLPVLASGNNPVTIDDTITELKIVPRYWIL